MSTSTGPTIAMESDVSNKSADTSQRRRARFQDVPSEDPDSSNRSHKDSMGNQDGSSRGPRKGSIDSQDGSSRRPRKGSIDSQDGSSRPRNNSLVDDSLHSQKSFVIKRYATGAAPAADHRKRVEAERTAGIVLPWHSNYRAWWSLTVFGAIFTFFAETYEVAFSPAGLKPYNDAGDIIQYMLFAIFFIDILINFRVAYFDDEDEVVLDKRKIARHYYRTMFWVDFLGVFPFYAVFLAITGEMGQDSRTAQYLALLRLITLVRAHRVKKLFDVLENNPRLSFMWITLIRNYSVAMLWAHFSACVLYFIARQYDFDPDTTWIGSSLEGMNGFERYVTSLYWAVVTISTVGYGDYSPVNAAEQIWGIIYMMLNLVILAWVIGSMTLLIVKHDEKTSLYREALQVLKRFTRMHNFEKSFSKSLKTQLQLEFNNREVSDEEVLKHFPSEVRRKVLRRLYLPSLMQTSLLKDTRQHFVDAFLTSCSVEIFNSGEEILQRGSIATDLYLLVAGSVKLVPWTVKTLGSGSVHDNSVPGNSSVADSEYHPNDAAARTLEAGHFINEIGFFTESPQLDTVRTTSVCKTLTLSRSAYRMIEEQHPAGAGIVLQNLLHKVEAMADEAKLIDLPKRLETIRGGSSFAGSASVHEFEATMAELHSEAMLTTVRDLVKMHMNKVKDDHTTRFLFAASRDDVATIILMCDQGFDPNSADYDFRTALMVASMKGNLEAVKKLLEYHADPNLTDMHGSSALYEAVRNGNDDVAEVLLEHGATLVMDEARAASTLCQAVFDGNIVLLRRLLRSKIYVDAADYDKRTAALIAGAEGNVAALRVLVEFGADLSLHDRWGNTVFDEAERVGAGIVLEYLKSLEPQD